MTDDHRRTGPGPATAPGGADQHDRADVEAGGDRPREADSQGDGDGESDDRDAYSKIRLNPADVSELLIAASEGRYPNRDELIVKLGAHAGLRVSETVDVRAGDLEDEPIGGDIEYWLRVRNAKDTREDGDGKERKVWLPRDLYTDARAHINQQNLGPRDHLIQSQKGGALAPGSARRVVRRLGERAADNTGRDKLRSLSSHDLRRYFATRLLVDEGANPRVVMRLGGWEHFSAIEPYLHDATDSTVARELGRVDFP